MGVFHWPASGIRNGAPAKNEFGEFLASRKTSGKVLLKRRLSPPAESLEVAPLRKVIHFENSPWCRCPEWHPGLKESRRGKKLLFSNRHCRFPAEFQQMATNFGQGTQNFNFAAKIPKKFFQLQILHFCTKILRWQKDFQSNLQRSKIWGEGKLPPFHDASAFEQGGTKS